MPWRASFSPALLSLPLADDAAVQFLILALAGAPPGVSGLSFGKSPDQLKTKVILGGAKEGGC